MDQTPKQALVQCLKKVPKVFEVHKKKLLWGKQRKFGYIIIGTRMSS